MNNYDYPMGADTSNAPWNQVKLPEREIEVTVSITISKTVKVLVNDYKVDTSDDEDGIHTFYDYSDCDINRAVEEQVALPHNLAEFTENMFDYDLNLKAVGMPKYLKDAITDCKGWTVDEMEIINEE